MQSRPEARFSNVHEILWAGYTIPKYCKSPYFFWNNSKWLPYKAPPVLYCFQPNFASILRKLLLFSPWILKSNRIVELWNQVCMKRINIVLLFTIILSKIAWYYKIGDNIQKFAFCQNFTFFKIWEIQTLKS